MSSDESKVYRVIHNYKKQLSYLCQYSKLRIQRLIAGSAAIISLLTTNSCTFNYYSFSKGRKSLVKNILFSGNVNPQYTGTICTVISSTLFFLAILTFTKRSTAVTGYRFLSLFLVFLTLNFADETLTITGTYLKYPVLMLIFQPGTYAIAPSFYLASIYLTSTDKKPNVKIVLHFIPYLIILALCIFAYLIVPDAVRANKTKGNDIDYIATIVLAGLLFLQIFSYLFLSFRQLKKHRQSIPLYLSSYTGNDYRWLSQIIIGLFMLSVIWLLETIVHKPELSLFAAVIYLCSFYYIGVQIMKQKDVVSFSPEQNLSDEDLPDMERMGEKYSPALLLDPMATLSKKKVLKDEQVLQLKHQLLEVMSTAKPYLDSEITLPKLSKMLHSNTYHLSYLLNDCLDENFYTFINRYRIEECMRMLNNPAYDHLTILGIAFECGFSSKTSFNISFKKITGMPPKAFKEQRQVDQEIKIGSSVSNYR